MLVSRGYSFRLIPNASQAATLSRWIGTWRAIYNAALIQRETFWRAYKRAEGRNISFASQCRELTQLRKEFDWIAACPQMAEQQALKDLHRAFQNFFEGRSAYPTPRKRGQRNAIRFPGKEITFQKLNTRNARVRIPKLGWLRFRLSRDLPKQRNNRPDIREVTLSRDALGWSVTFSLRFDSEALQAADAAVGIDRGVANSVALSNAVLPSFPREAIRAASAKKTLHQRRAAAKRGSKRRRKAIQRAARQGAKAARIRKHANHVSTTRIAKAFRNVVLEDLRVRNMTASAKGTLAEPGRNVRAKAGLNRSILETGWSQFERMLEYKIIERGGEIRLVDPRNTSRRCPQCGHVDAENRKTQALFHCVECGHEAHADINAAVNILKAGTRPSRSSQEHQSRESRAA